MGRNIPNCDLKIRAEQVQPEGDGRKINRGSMAREGYECLDSNDPEYDLDRRGIAEPVSVRPRRWPRNEY
jgi:hypothetical protein